MPCDLRAVEQIVGPEPPPASFSSKGSGFYHGACELGWPSQLNRSVAYLDIMKFALAMKVALKPLLIGSAAGLALSIPMIYLLASSAFGVSESPYIARVLFPYAAAVNQPSNAWVILSFLFLQYPVYGSLLGIACNQVRNRLLIVLALLTVLFACHIAAVRSAHRVDAIWVESQAHE